jgi:hypothetical protein
VDATGAAMHRPRKATKRKLQRKQLRFQFYYTKWIKKSGEKKDFASGNDVIQNDR